jgi:2,4-dienoyl-CoA reductase-like NADH-dependent reductase (Old Yellow Enzyme family)
VADLFTPLRIGGVEVANRLMQAAHSKLYGHDGHDTDQDVAYFERRARGGVGLVVAGNRFVHPSASIRGFPDGFREDGIPSGRRLTEAVQAHGTRIFVQLNHHGAQAQPQGPDGPRAVYSASRVISPSTGVATTAATSEDIAAFVEGWAHSAWIARESGFDGVEVHMAHGYLLQQFLSPLYNFRTDGYGGDLAGRTRFPREVLRAVRERVGDDYVVGIRIVADEFIPGGLTNADVLDIIDLLRAEARVDFIDLGAGGYHNPHYVFPSAAMPAAWMRDEVAAVKARNPDVAVFGVGAAPDIETAGEVIRSGIADMVALTRAQIADPDLADKLRSGRTDEVTHCIRLNQGCLGRGASGLPMSCTVNPVVGRERERDTPPAAARRQRWVVVGGGPAGMKTAETLAVHGHDVTLLERGSTLGGQLRLAATIPGRQTLEQLIVDLTRSLDRHDVEVRLDTEATEELLTSLTADGVVLATGARPPPMGTSLAGTTPLTAGSAAGPPVVDAWTALETPGSVGSRVAMLDDDGTSYAAGIALALLERGHDVHVFSWFDTLFPHVMATMDRPLLLERLHARGVAVTRNARVTRSDAGVTVTDALSGRVRDHTDVDTIVLATPRESVVLDGIRLQGARVASVGDCVSPRTIDAAIFEAFELGFSVGRAPATSGS